MVNDTFCVFPNFHQQIQIMLYQLLENSIKKMLYFATELDIQDGLLTVINPIQMHPPQDTQSRVSIIHNGIIENYSTLKENLIKKGCVFRSQTDTEVVAVQIGYFLDQEGPIKESIQKTMLLLTGTWAICVLHIDFPDKMWIFRMVLHCFLE